VGLIFAVIFVLKHRWLLLETWLAAVVGSVALDQLLKVLFARLRPVFEHPLLHERGYSFPSGHVMDSLVVYGILAYFAVLALRT
jgi:undecaprenyl-diphosphatase